MGIEETQQAVYELLTSEDDGRVCRDIPEEACDEQPQNFTKHVISLAATKTGDGLVDPKLVLSWLLTALGAPAFMIGFLVPLREAGALLPQLFIAATVRGLPQRKWVWAGGSLVQGLCLLGMAAAALTLTGAAAGWAILVLLAVFASARAACSVSYKDVLGKTVSKATRGTATGTASSIAAALVLAFGLLLSLGLLEKSLATIAAALTVAAGLWILAAAVFATLAEQSGATEGGGDPIAVAREQVSLLWRDPQLTRFIATRGLLTATALAPPYLLALAGREGGGELGQLGLFVVASALAGMGGGYVWGRLSDKSSRKVLLLSALVAAAVLALCALVGWWAPGQLTGGVAAPALLLVLMIAYQGVRLGRSTHIVDMAGRDDRAAYTALSNSVIGILLLAGGAFGFLAQAAGEATVLAVFAIMSALAALTAWGLREEQAREA
ncbi:MFS transporter [Pelagibius marinus]|uniref:MFS transporter n=1 Tax=Pelagibius marinus TaxID=2762760 RepID=UPI001872C00E|nr:MFS transporter [Pelagibius marinus]